MIAGLSIIAYPFVAGAINKYKHANSTKSYVETVENSSENIEEILAEAEEYNKRFTDILVGDPYSSPTNSDDQDYWNSLQIRNTEIMSKLTIPSLGINLPVYHGNSEAVLRKGVGHLYGTSLPVGGLGTHSVMSAHAGLVEDRMFDDLPKIQLGDKVIIETLGRKMTYQIDDIQIVLPEEGANMLKIDPMEDRITVLTCYPYSINTHRFMAAGIRVPNDPEMEAETRGLIYDQRFLIGTAVVISIIAFGVGRNRYRASKRKQLEIQRKALREEVFP